MANAGYRHVSSFIILRSGMGLTVFSKKGPAYFDAEKM